MPRKTACGHDCEECAGCGVNGTAVQAKAVNAIGARPGQKVVVESSTQKMLRIIALVYLIPVALFLAGYLAAALLTASVGIHYLTAAVGFAAGVLVAISYDRKLPRNWNGSAAPTAACATPWDVAAVLPPGSF